MKPDFYVDIHCHPSIKPYARSFRHQAGVQSRDPQHESSVWFADKPSLFDKIKNYVASLTNFVQSDGQSLLAGKVCVACLSFYPQEKGFFANKLGTGIPADLMTMLVTEFGKERIDHIQHMPSYWDDLLADMAYMVQREGEKVVIGTQEVRYTIARSYADIAQAIQQGELGKTHVVFVPTIEGAHVFDQMMDSNEPWEKYPNGVSDTAKDIMLKRILQLRIGGKKLIRPAFITLAHHFWNGLAGHERSLGDLVKCAVDQENGLKAGLTEAGKEAILAMLGPKQHSGQALPPIHIDVKHMNRPTRDAYYKFVKQALPGMVVPIIVSHGGVTGLDKPGGTSRSAAAKEGLFYDKPINFYDDELLMIEASGGIFGIQLDERRIGSKQALRGARGNISRKRILKNWAKLVWNQVRHMAEVLDAAGKPAWGIQSLGTDFDGIIDPINGYWTAASMDELHDYLLLHARDYLQGSDPCPLVKAANRNTPPEEVAARVMTNNALGFLSRIF